jgi:hypothetical protein
MKWLSGLLLFCAMAAAADESVSICYNYGCLAQAEIVYSTRQLDELGAVLANPRDAAQERAALGTAVGLLLGWAGEQSPIKADRGGNYADEGVDGRMDCIDHSLTTTRLLLLIERQGWLHHHRVVERVLRRRFLLFEHYSAQIEEVAPGRPGDPPERYVVDSWFFDNGKPAVVMPLARWQDGESPDGDD